ncbi:penicillin-binding transpeptidase domain-containing protein [Ruania halotolerans]|uniref:penicillin-binding transpeptidase domain-containing protein n=1 Tax=Ruania halotolerans TaxID=2897773 RepID=UPI001E53B10C|nr:penicillin-binding transpeptidase domain-containing protein [Ruania halotolerans]UFU07818.1 penicillin-binding protein [Ruania halotolerans]
MSIETALLRRSAAIVATASLLLVACTGEDPEPEEAASPELDAAAALAEALTTGDLAGAPLTDDDRALATEQAEEVLGELTPLVPRTVEVTWSSSVYEEEEADGVMAADAALTWTWDVPGTDEEWTYPASVHLTSTDDGPWIAQWSRDLLAPDLGEDGVITVEQGSAERGDILGRDDEVLITDREVFQIGIDKTYIDADQWEEDALALAEALEFDDPQAYADRVLSAGERAFVVATVVPQDDPGDVDMEAVREIEGVNLVTDERQQGPTQYFAYSILGRVGEATSEIIDGSDGAIQQGDHVGVAGLQLAYDEQLRGIGGLTISVTSGEESSEVYSSEPVDGEPLRTTLDRDLQQRAEGIVDGLDVPAGVVAIEPSTGNLLAASSSAASNGWSTATLGQYAPGSTFKVVTLLALLRSGMSLDDSVSCTDTLTVNGREFSNYPGYPESSIGDITLEEAIAQSCNTALMSVRDQITAADLADAAASLGLGRGDDASLGYPVWLGSVPTEAEGTLHAAGLIGQGQVLASPLAMAGVAASISAGHVVTPILVDSEEYREAAEAAREVPTALTETEATLLRQAMRAVVTDGTASGPLADVTDDGDLIAKTGTAEYDGGTHAWMIAVQGDMAVAVFLEEGSDGAGAAGPLMAQFLGTS